MIIESDEIEPATAERCGPAFCLSISVPPVAVVAELIIRRQVADVVDQRTGVTQRKSGFVRAKRQRIAWPALIRRFAIIQAKDAGKVRVRMADTGIIGLVRLENNRVPRVLHAAGLRTVPVPLRPIDRLMIMPEARDVNLSLREGDCRSCKQNRGDEESAFQFRARLARFAGNDDKKSANGGASVAAQDRHVRSEVSLPLAFSRERVLRHRSEKMVEKTLEKSAQLFAVFMDNLSGFAWIKDLDGRYVYANKTLEQLEPYRNGWLGKTDADLWPAEIASAFNHNDKHVIVTKRQLQTVERYFVNNSERSVLVSKFPIFDGAGEVEMVGGVSVDIT